MAEGPPGARSMTKEELRGFCSRVYGAHLWQTALAKELQINDRTVRRWAAGASPIPRPVTHCVRLMVFLDESRWLGAWRKQLKEEGPWDPAKTSALSDPTRP